MTGFARKPHITRYFMHRHLRCVGERTFSGQACDVLTISGSQKLCEVLNLKSKSLVESDYPKHNLLHLDFLPNSLYSRWASA